MKCVTQGTARCLKLKYPTPKAEEKRKAAGSLRGVTDDFSKWYVGEEQAVAWSRGSGRLGAGAMPCALQAVAQVTARESRWGLRSLVSSLKIHLLQGGNCTPSGGILVVRAHCLC